MIFVFGSNLAGRHGKGAALFARQYRGAVYGVGVGRTGNSYAIPTKDQNLRTLALPQIQEYVNDFLEYARANPNEKFEVTRVGCGLAGYSDSDIAPMFSNAPSNCILPDGWGAPQAATQGEAVTQLHQALQNAKPGEVVNVPHEIARAIDDEALLASMPELLEIRKREQRGGR